MARTENEAIGEFLTIIYNSLLEQRGIPYRLENVTLTHKDPPTAPSSET